MKVSVLLFTTLASVSNLPSNRLRLTQSIFSFRLSVPSKSKQFRIFLLLVTCLSILATLWPSSSLKICSFTPKIRKETKILNASRHSLIIKLCTTSLLQQAKTPLPITKDLKKRARVRDHLLDSLWTKVLLTSMCSSAVSTSSTTATSTTISALQAKFSAPPVPPTSEWTSCGESSQLMTWITTKSCP